jgi:hypothetical protein
VNCRRIEEWIGFAALVSSGVAVRFFLRDYPNFAPVAGVALFAGYYFRSWILAASIPIAIMAITDLFIGGYHPIMMLCVYAMLVLPVSLRRCLRRWMPITCGSLRSSVFSCAGLIACGLVSSLLFFVVTNFAAWLLFDMYEKSVAGLIRCYLQAVPFFRYTLAGDLFFSSLLFAGYAIANCLKRQVMPSAMEMLPVGAPPGIVGQPEG